MIHGRGSHIMTAGWRVATAATRTQDLVVDMHSVRPAGAQFLHSVLNSVSTAGGPLVMAQISHRSRCTRITRTLSEVTPMTIVQYEPWTLVRRLQRRLDEAFGETLDTAQTVSWIPSVDVHEADDRFVVRADLPGVDPKDIEITTERDTLTLRGERRAEKTTDSGNAHRVERVAGTFVRRFTLPENARVDAITATHTNGVLELSIPKEPKPEPRRIKVEAA
jgi:HSP20 family protein